MRILIAFLSLAAYATADVKHLTDRNIDLFKYNPTDVYTLPEDIDDDKPAVFFNGDVQKAKVERLQSLNGNKKFKLDLKTQNGIEVTQVGKLKDDKTFVVSGSYSFTGADGKRYRTRYTADEFGYHPITELDLDIPEPQTAQSASESFGNKFGANDRNSFGNIKNKFQFLNQNLNLEVNEAPIRGSNQMGDDYSYNGQRGDQYEGPGLSGYDYNPPQYQFETPSNPPNPSRAYLPVQ